MKTEFETEEERLFLSKLLWTMVQHTDPWVLFPSEIQRTCTEYIEIMRVYRKKCFEYLETEDPNSAVLEIIDQNKFLD